MKNSLRIVIAAAITLVAALLLALVSSKTKSLRSGVSCTGLEVAILDSASFHFVDPEDVKQYITEGYGTFTGQRIDSVNLRKIEEVLASKSSLMSGEAWISQDGVLHVEVTQREPVVELRGTGKGFYADENGYIFPLHPDYKAPVPLVEGKIPINVPDGFKGYPSEEEEKQWLEGVIALLDYTGKNKFWKGAIAKISVEGDGSLVLKPSEGRESFIFGKPSDVEDKFARMEEYYQYIAPAKDSAYYKTVDVRYKGQIICRQK